MSLPERAARPPVLRVFNRQRKIVLDLPWIRAVVAKALPDCLSAARPESALLSLAEVSAVIVSDRVIADVHGQFLEDPEPTDVITFDHGEILVGAGVVAGQGPEFGHNASEETALCIIHGLLHLGGWLDGTAREAKAMAGKQSGIFQKASRL